MRWLADFLQASGMAFWAGVAVTAALSWLLRHGKVRFVPAGSSEADEPHAEARFTDKEQ